MMTIVVSGTDAAQPSIPAHEARRLAPKVEIELDNIRNDVAQVCAAARAGRFKGRAQITVGRSLPDVREQTLSFSQDSLDADLDRVQSVIDRYEQALVVLHRRARGQHEEPPKEMSLEDRLRQAEAGTARREPDRFVIPEDNFNASSSYLDDRKARQAERDRQAEADMARVAEERRLAAMRRQEQEAVDRKIEEQNTRWQQELDRQATQDAEAEAEWKRTHGTGAFLKGLARTVVGGTITSVTGSFATTMANHYARTLIHDRFPPHHGRGRYPPPPQ